MKYREENKHKKVLKCRGKRGWLGTQLLIPLGFLFVLEISDIELNKLTTQKCQQAETTKALSNLLSLIKGPERGSVALYTTFSLILKHNLFPSFMKAKPYETLDFHHHRVVLRHSKTTVVVISEKTK